MVLERRFVTRRHLLGVAISALLLSFVAFPAGALGEEPAEEPQPTEPLASDLTEQAGSELLQIEVLVSGPPDEVATLTREDFVVKVDWKRRHDFMVDRVCEDLFANPVPVDPGSERLGVDEPATPEQAAGNDAAPRGTFVLYFDQTQLTIAGRAESIGIARELVPELVRGGLVSIVSRTSARGSEVKTFAHRSRSAEDLLAALDRLERDTGHWDTWAENEVWRYRQITEAPNASHAMLRAGVSAREEIAETNKSIQTLAVSLEGLADREGAKALFFFANTFRRDPGAHYLDLFPSYDRSNTLVALRAASELSTTTFDRLIEVAAGRQIRVYPVSAGMFEPGAFRSMTSSFKDTARMASGATSVSFGIGVNDRPLRVSGVVSARETLHALALETGGRAYVENRAYGKTILREVVEDFGCRYLLSLDASMLRKDRGMPVSVRTTRAGITVRAPGTLVRQSEKARRESRLFAAFVNADSSGAGQDSRIQASVLPLEFEAGRFKMQLQVGVGGTRLTPAEWDVGASVISGGRVVADGAGRVRVGEPFAPVVFELNAEVAPGSYEVVMVAHEIGSDRVLSHRHEGELPDPRDAPITLIPVSIVQRAAGAFLREAEARNAGNRVLPGEQPVRSDRDAAFIGLVCWGRGRKLPVEMTRVLRGETTVEFPPTVIEPGEGRCRMFSDLVAGGTMTAGAFAYEVRASASKRPAVTHRVEFLAVTPRGEPRPNSLSETGESWISRRIGPLEAQSWLMASQRRCISSGATSSMVWPISQRWPKGSCTLPPRSP